MYPVRMAVERDGDRISPSTAAAAMERSICCCRVRFETFSAPPEQPLGRNASTSAISTNVTIRRSTACSSCAGGREIRRARTGTNRVACAGGSAEDRAHAADDHDHERVEQPLAVLAAARRTTASR